jgi:8-oxo-dGTP pyrophosphatase MutT (NUDIX family)
MENMETKKETSAGIIVYYKEKQKISINDKIKQSNKRTILKYLLLHYEEGHWDFPKGHVEIGETHEEAAMRETKEETGLIVNVNPLFKEKISYFFKSNETLIHKDVYFFVGEANTKEVNLSKEHIGYVWLSYENALKKLTYENAKELLKKANWFLENNYIK